MNVSSADILSQIARSSGSGLLALGPTGTILFANRALERLVGVSGTDLVGRRPGDVIAGWSAKEDEIAAACLSEDRTRSAPVRLDGDIREAIFAPFHADDGAAVGVSITVREITAAERERRASIESDRRFRVMADASPVLLWMAGTDGLCHFFNQPWLAFTGRTMEMEQGVGWAEGVHPEDFQSCMSTFMSSFVARRAFRMEYRLRRADGAYRWLLDTGIPHLAADGSFEGFIGSCIDITELKDTTDTLDRTVRERTAELEAFSYSVSHDLRAPLRVIDGFGRELLTDHCEHLDERGRHFVSRIRAATQRMGALIDGMLALSQITRAELIREQVDLGAMAEAILAELKEQQPERAAEVVIATGLVTNAEPRLVHAVLENLLGNAWKFTSGRAVTRIELGRDDRGIFFVRDNGAGFDIAHAKRLFAPFQRLHSAQQFEGTGIGLATVQRIVSRHGGHLSAEAAVEEGATFHFSFEGTR